MYVRGNTTGTTVIGETTCGTNLTQLCWCSTGGVQGDRLGNIYVSDSWNNRVLRYNKHSGKVTVTLGVSGVAGCGPNLLSWPRELYVDGNDTLFVYDINNSRMQKRIADGVMTTTVLFNTFGLLFWSPALTFDPYGSIYLSANHGQTSYVVRLVSNAYMYTTLLDLLNAYPSPIAMMQSMRIDKTTGAIYISFPQGIAKFDLARNSC